MLRKINHYATDSIKDWENNHKELRKRLPELRKEVNSLSEDRDIVIAQLAKIDGLIAIPAIMNILETIKIATEKNIEILFEKLAHKNIKKVIANDKIDNIILKVLNTKTNTILQKLIDERTTALTEEKIRINMDAYINQFYSAIKSHFSSSDQIENFEESFKQLLRNEFFLLFAYEIYNEVDKRQTAGLWISALMAPYLMKDYPSEALKNPFIIIQHAAALTVPEDLALWNELRLWLEGLHARTFWALPKANQVDLKTGEVTKLNDGTYPLTEGPSRKNDADLKGHFQITLYDIAFLYLQISKTIELKVNAVASLQVTQDELVIPLHSSAKQEKVEDKAKDKILSLNLLELIMNDKNEVKFDIMIKYLYNYNLDPNQLQNLTNLDNIFVPKLESYNNSWFKTHYGLLNLSILGGRPHSASITTTITSIQATSNVVEKIEIIYNLWINLKSKNSTDASNLLIDLLDSVFQFLYRGAQQTALANVLPSPK